MSARRALAESGISEFADIPRRAAVASAIERPVEFIRPRRAALKPVRELTFDAVAASPGRAMMSLPAIGGVQAKQVGIGGRMRVPLAAVTMISALGLGASFLPKAVAIPVQNPGQTVAQPTTEATPVATVTDSVAASPISQTNTVAQQQETAQQISDAFSNLGKSTSAKLAADQAAAARAAETPPSAAVTPSSAAPARVAPSPSTKPSASAASNSTVQAALDFALAQIGKPYVWGAVGPNSYDCSGLMMAAYRAAGVNIPRTTYTQKAAGKPVAMKDLQPGDLVFFDNDGHVGMYIGKGKVVHAPQPGENVQITSVSAMSSSGAVRIIV